MEYLSADEYEKYGLSATTPASLAAGASALIDAHCRRKTLGVAEYTERTRLGRTGSARLSYLPLACGAGATTPIVRARVRYRACSDLHPVNEIAAEVAQAFGMAGMWADVTPDSLDVRNETGELTVALPGLTPPFSEMEITYTAGLEPVPEAVKHACAMIVRNAQATPALNVRGNTVDRMHLEYFSDSLLDTNVRALLAPYVAQKAG